MKKKVRIPNLILQRSESRANRGGDDCENVIESGEGKSTTETKFYVNDEVDRPANKSEKSLSKREWDKKQRIKAFQKRWSKTSQPESHLIPNVLRLKCH